MTVSEIMELIKKRMLINIKTLPLKSKTIAYFADILADFLEKNYV